MRLRNAALAFWAALAWPLLRKPCVPPSALLLSPPLLSPLAFESLLPLGSLALAGSHCSAWSIEVLIASLIEVSAGLVVELVWPSVAPAAGLIDELLVSMSPTTGLPAIRFWTGSLVGAAPEVSTQPLAMSAAVRWASP